MSAHGAEEPVPSSLSSERSASPPTAKKEAPPSTREGLNPQNRDSQVDLDLLFARYSRLVFGIAYRVLGDTQEAEDLLQEVFFYVYRKPAIFDPLKGSVRAWIIQFAFSRAFDRKMYLARRGFYTGGDIGSLELRGKSDPEHDIEVQINRKHLEKAFSALSEAQRRTIQLFYFDDLDLREISEYLSEPLGSVRHHLYRGLARLRRNPEVLRLRT
ncbi:MAG: sigma-70 family RNA polymerase sigma factor [Acidobacteriaceae bacterium]|nr:sigma-70 family RNA polymerase sigma factor [Acidobacteriaceae bacterium]